jgi:hypothetical protein
MLPVSKLHRSSSPQSSHRIDVGLSARLAQSPIGHDPVAFVGLDLGFSQFVSQVTVYWVLAAESLGESISVGGLDWMDNVKRSKQGRRVASLKHEQAVYEANLNRWLPDRQGKFVLIKDDRVAGFYDSRDEALAAGYSRFGIGPLFVKQVTPFEPVHHIPSAII